MLENRVFGQAGGGDKENNGVSNSICWFCM